MCPNKTNPDPKKEGPTFYEKASLALSILAIIASIGGICLNNWIVNTESDKQQLTAQHNTAQAIYFDIKRTHERYAAALKRIGTVNDSFFCFDSVPYLIPNSVYYTFNKEIADFPDEQLSSDIYNFYQTTYLIDEERSYLQQVNEKYAQNPYGIIPTESALYNYNQIMVNSKAMTMNMLVANQNANTILKTLKTEYNLSQPSTVESSLVNFQCSYIQKPVPSVIL